MAQKLNYIWVNKMKFTKFIEHIEKKNKKAVIKALKDTSFDPTQYSHHAISKAIDSKDMGILGLLIKDSRMNPIINDNNALMKAYFEKNEPAFLLLLKTPKVISSINNDWVKENIELDKYKKIAIQAISIYNF